MTTQEVKRKLTAILSADVKGYSRLMGEDEKGTVRTLNTYKEVMAGLIQHHHGRVVDAPGDNMLAEFASVVNAVECSVEIQRELKTRNAEFPENRRMEFRIGVNLGDVIEEEDKIYGDGVNIAARLESLSEGGGVCISGTVYENVENKLPLEYEYLGEQKVKNIARPVQVYRVLMELGTMAPRTPKVEVASKEKMAYPLPDVPSIAVLPFVNMSEDPKQEFFSDGITENIITVLSKVPRLFVISRQSTFFYKGKPVKVKQVSEELGVRYVLEGSVQRSGDRIRINAQLIDALTGHHLWAERYDRDLADLFALQDEITMKILTAVRVKLTEGEISSAYSKYYGGKQGLDCYLKLMEAAKYGERMNIEDNNVARRLNEEAISMCPGNPVGYAQLSWVYMNDYWLVNTKSPRETLEKGYELAKKTLAIDDSIPIAHTMLCALYMYKREYDKAIAEGERAVALDPSGYNAYSQYATALLVACRPEEAIPMFQKAIRLNPNASTTTFVMLGHALRNAGRFEEAVPAYKIGIQRAPDYIVAHIGLATTYSLMGREKEARAEAAEILRIDPKFSLDHFAKTGAPYKDQSEIDKIINAMRKVGLK
jgi:adenylate cyclase